jgi:hypothetical protein
MQSKIDFRVTCTREDRQGPARVMGIFASRDLLPTRFSSNLHPTGVVHVEVSLKEETVGAPGPCHLARLIARIPTVASVELFIDGKPTVFDLMALAEPIW